MRWLFRFLERIFGAVTWSPPPWLAGFRSWAGTHRALALALLAAMAGCVGGGTWLGIWYAHRPPPQRVAVFVDDIPVTRLERVLHPAPIRIRFGGSAAPLSLIGNRVNTGVSLSQP